MYDPNPQLTHVPCPCAHDVRTIKLVPLHQSPTAEMANGFGELHGHKFHCRLFQEIMYEDALMILAQLKGCVHVMHNSPTSCNRFRPLKFQITSQGRQTEDGWLVETNFHQALSSCPYAAGCTFYSLTAAAQLRHTGVSYRMLIFSEICKGPMARLHMKTLL